MRPLATGAIELLVLVRLSKRADRLPYFDVQLRRINQCIMSRRAICTHLDLVLTERCINRAWRIARSRLLPVPDTNLGNRPRIVASALPAFGTCVRRNRCLLLSGLATDVADRRRLRVLLTEEFPFLVQPVAVL